MNPRIGNTLRRYRLRRGLLNYQAAYRFDVSPATWSRYETDHQTMPDDLLARVAVTWRAWGLLRGHPAVRATVEALLAEGLLRHDAGLHGGRRPRGPAAGAGSGHGRPGRWRSGRARPGGRGARGPVDRRGTSAGVRGGPADT